MHPVVNIDDPAGKTVGRRTRFTKQGYLDYAFGLQKTLASFPRPAFPKGVFRFRTYEEADQWLMDHSTRKPAN